MQPDLTAATASLAGEYDALSRALRLMPYEAWERLTVCAPWRVRDLVAHIIKGATRLGAIDVDPNPPRVHESNAYYSSPLRADPERDQKRMRGIAEMHVTYPTEQSLLAAFDEVAAAAMRRCAELPALSYVRVHWGISVPATEYVQTRIVEAVVHGLDLEDSKLMAGRRRQRCNRSTPSSKT